MPDEYGERTWLYLRIAMILLVVGLAASLGYEHWAHDPGCLLGSISAFYYTPVRAVFVATLVAVGVCLVCVRGSTTPENVFLNLAGAFAPFVAFIPTPKPTSCVQILVTNQGADANVANNVLALLVVGGLALALTTWLARRPLAGTSARDWWIAIGLAAGWVAWLIAVSFDIWGRSDVIAHGHYIAAIAMFACIVAAAIANAVDRADWGWEIVTDRYMIIAVVMVLVVVGGVIGHAVGWQHWVLFTEIGLISSFATLWAIQTHELGGGLRSRVEQGDG